ncbi:hypothetical protein A3Q56_08318, partial [Intoshia linei]
YWSIEWFGVRSFINWNNLINCDIICDAFKNVLIKNNLSDFDVNPSTNELAERDLQNLYKLGEKKLPIKTEKVRYNDLIVGLRNKNWFIILMDSDYMAFKNTYIVSCFKACFPQLRPGHFVILCGFDQDEELFYYIDPLINKGILY